MPLPSRIRSSVQGRLNRNLTGKLDDQFHLIHAVKNELWARLEQLSDEFADLHESVRTYSALNQSASQRESAETRETLAHHLEELARKVDELPASRKLAGLLTGSISDIDEDSARFLNYAASHVGPLRDAGLWINHPISLRWGQGEATIGSINERIVEQPFVMAHVADLVPGAKVLDIGGGESTLNLSMASLGLDVTVVEPQGYPFAHPNLRVIPSPIEECEFDTEFDAITLLSTIEHFGIGHYANNPSKDARADLDAMKFIRALLKPGGRLILTTPYGSPSVDERQRVYDAVRLADLLEGFEIEQKVFARQFDDGNWSVVPSISSTTDKPGVVMVKATIPSDS